MAGYRRSQRRNVSKGRRNVQGYTLRGRNGRINYVGVSNNPKRRATEHRKRGKQGKMKVETRGMSRKKARSWESRRLNIFRRNHSGKNPPLNKSRDGGFQ